MRAGVAVMVALTASGCMQTAPNSPVSQQSFTTDLTEKRYQQDLKSRAHADKVTSEARGTKRCTIKQFTSAHRSRQSRQASAALNTSIYLSASSNIVFKVERDGSVGIAVRDDTYPGTRAHFLIDGKRFSGDARHYVDVTGVLPALKRDSVVKYSYNHWPYRHEVNQEDVIVGFADAYVECLTFLKGGPSKEN